MLSDKTLRLVPRTDTYKPEFLELALRTRVARKFIEARATGTSFSMRNISQETISAIPVPTPLPDEQARVATALSRRLSVVDSLIAECRAELVAINNLPAALLRHAFSFTTD
jgi:type I restriction enzyme S subunit